MIIFERIGRDHKYKNNMITVYFYLYVISRNSLFFGGM